VTVFQPAMYCTTVCGRVCDTSLEVRTIWGGPQHLMLSHTAVNVYVTGYGGI